jgi:hypothetical protein
MGRGSRSGYRVPAPAPADRVEWPEDFGTRFTIFVDTEEEFDWRAPLSRDGHGTAAIAALPDMHRRFALQGVPVTYLVDYPVAASSAAVDVIRRLLEDGHSAVGAQLHAWVTPPFEEEISIFNSFSGNLPKLLEAAKLATLTRTLETAFGTPPRVYRAGRYGLGPDTLSLLAELGYRVDTSVRAWYDYSPEGGPDFSAVGAQAFRAGRLLELPFTTVFTGRLRGQGNGLYRALGRVPKGRGVAARLGLLSRVALTPEDMPLADAIEAVRVAVGEGLRLLNFAFHSPSVEPGHTPYVRDAADLAAFHRWWEVMLNLLQRIGVRPASQAQLIAAFDAACGTPAPSAIGAAAGGL